MPPLRASGALHSNLTAPVRLLFRRSLCARDPDQTTRGDAPRGPQSPSNPAGCDGTPTQSMLFQSPFSVHKRGGGERHQAPSAFSTARSKSNGTLKVCSCCGRRPRRFDPRSLEPPPPPQPGHNVGWAPRYVPRGAPYSVELCRTGPVHGPRPAPGLISARGDRSPDLRNVHASNKFNNIGARATN